MSENTLNNHSDLVWKIAEILRGTYRPPQYRRVMIPMIVLRRLDCVLEATREQVKAELAKPVYQSMPPIQIEETIKRKLGIPFHNRSDFSFKKLLDDADKLETNLNKFISSFSVTARRILEKFEFDKEITKMEDANRLFEVVKAFADMDLHPDRLSNLEMGYIFEDLVRRFNEQANEEAGDHFTPREVINLMVSLVFASGGDQNKVFEDEKLITVYDPTCGTGGMLSEAEKFIKAMNSKANIRLYGQEYNAESYAICGSDLMIKNEPTQNIVYGDTLGTGRSKPDSDFVDGDGHPNQKFHYLLANPPFGVEWKNQKNHVTAEYEKGSFNGRFGAGLPRINDGALLFLLHMISKMRAVKDKDNGARIAVVFNGSPLFTGDAGSGESNIRRWIIENDWLEAVVGLPDQLFYNTGIYTYVWILNNNKAPARRGKVQLINATQFFVKMKKSLGNKRNEIGNGQGNKPDHIAEITRIYNACKDDDTRVLVVGDKPIKVSKVFRNQEFAYLKLTVERPLRLNFRVDAERLQRFKDGSYFSGLALSQKRKDLQGQLAEIAAGKQRQADILSVLVGMKVAFADGQLVMDRVEFSKQLKAAFTKAKVKTDAVLLKALLLPNALGERDPQAKPCIASLGGFEPDADLRDTEQVALPPDVTLPLPIGYNEKDSKKALIALIKAHCNDYLKREVLPYRADAWIDFEKTKVGYEIPFTRHFYEYQAPRPLAVIGQEVKDLEAEIARMLEGVI
ncbi:type I restriction-modification system subunit M [Thiothrix lacustris]|uniref:type I restriction-modification system subunit M n=1 Tax=Thiothrix lacustris TaxID=525917 RepID=UPI00048F7C61|nr:class I SAM-dependent DNA methyltransferase [Thiothrix lacustris]